MPDAYNAEHNAQHVRNVIEEIHDERVRQYRREGWSAGHDDEHGNGQLARAAAAYALQASAATYRDGAPAIAKRQAKAAWPWDPSDFKPKDSRRDLVRAAALIVAEIERLDRERGGDARK